MCLYVSQHACYFILNERYITCIYMYYPACFIPHSPGGAVCIYPGALAARCVCIGRCEWLALSGWASVLWLRPIRQWSTFDIPILSLDIAVILSWLTIWSCVKQKQFINIMCVTVTLLYLYRRTAANHSSTPTDLRQSLTAFLTVTYISLQFVLYVITLMQNKNKDI